MSVCLSKLLPNDIMELAHGKTKKLHTRFGEVEVESPSGSVPGLRSSASHRMLRAFGLGSTRGRPSNIFHLCPWCGRSGKTWDEIFVKVRAPGVLPPLAPLGSPSRLPLTHLTFHAAGFTRAA